MSIEDTEQQDSEQPRSSRSRFLSFRFLLLLALVAALMPLAVQGWFDLYEGFLERRPPEISFEDFPRGIGIAPVKVKILLTDSNTGLDEVVVRTIQKGKVREIYRQSLNGEARSRIEVDFPGIKSKLEEGKFILSVKAFDRSFWSNVGQQELDLAVDYRKPKVEVLTTQHNARLGGSQLVFYRAFDEDLAYSGVKVGAKTFEGFPAKLIDSAFTDPNLYVAIYALDLDQNPNNSVVKVFAEDKVGNAISSPFYNKVAQREFRNVTVNVKEDFLREKISPLAANNFQILQDLARKSGRELVYKAGPGTVTRLAEEFKLVHNFLRKYNDGQIEPLLQGSRFERSWSGSFLKHPGVTELGFGDTVTYSFEPVGVLGVSVNKGYQIRSSPNDKVQAANDGVVIFSDDLGIYGRTVAVDHGLGIVTLYGRLGNILVREGDRVKKGEDIGVAGDSGFATSSQVYFQIRVQGVPVDPLEWWDDSWINAHVTDKINQVKRALGIPVYVTIGE